MIKYTDCRYSFEEGDFVKNVINDIAIISQNEAIVQHIIMRLLIPKGSYPLNPNLGSELFTLSQQKLTLSTEPRVKTMIQSALKPEIDAGNIDPNIDVQLDRTNDSINARVTVQIIDGSKEQINLSIT